MMLRRISVQSNGLQAFFGPRLQVYYIRFIIQKTHVLLYGPLDILNHLHMVLLLLVLN